MDDERLQKSLATRWKRVAGRLSKAREELACLADNDGLRNPVAATFKFLKDI